MKSLRNTVSLKKFEFLGQFIKALGNLITLDTELQYWAVTVQYLCRVKKISMTSNVLPLHFFPLARPAQAKIQNLTVICCIVKLIP